MLHAIRRMYTQNNREEEDLVYHHKTQQSFFREAQTLLFAFKSHNTSNFIINKPDEGQKRSIVSVVITVNHLLR